MSKLLQVEYTDDLEQAVGEVERNNTPNGLFSKQFMKRHGLHLVGTSMCWFFVAVSYYSSNIFQKDVFASLGWLPESEEMSAIKEVYMLARAHILLSLCGAFPGYWFAVMFIDTIGRFYIQLMGFLFMTIFILGLAIPYNYWITPDHNVGFIIMYAFTFFFANFGPNVTTFVVPAEIFPARLRSTCYGISAAAGKAGAMIGAFGFIYLTQPQDEAYCGYPAGIIGVNITLIILGVFCVLGLFFTFLLPEAKGKSLEEMSGENDEDQI